MKTAFISLLMASLLVGIVLVHRFAYSDHYVSSNIRFAPTPTISNESGNCDQKIAYVSGDQWWYDIYRITLKDPQPVKLTPDLNDENHSPDFSQDGQWIVFTSWDGTNADIYLMKNDGSNQRNLTPNTPSSRETDPSWSPDGNQVLFISDRDGDRELFVMNTDGSDIVQLTENTIGESDPVWSPDGTQIAFSFWNVGEMFEIALINADGSNSTQITDTTDNAHTFDPAWSPDGEWLVYVSDEGTDMGKYELFIMRPDGTDIKQLTDNGYRNFFPDWSPDENTIVFSSNMNADFDGDFELYMMDIDGSNITQLTHNQTDSDQQPTLGPVMCGEEISTP